MQYNSLRGKKINNFIILALLVSPAIITPVPLAGYLLANAFYAKIRNSIVSSFKLKNNQQHEKFLSSVYQSHYTAKYIDSFIASTIDSLYKKYPEAIAGNNLMDTRFLIDVYISSSMRYFASYDYSLVDKWLSFGQLDKASYAARVFANIYQATPLDDVLSTLTPEESSRFLAVIKECSSQMEKSNIPTKFMALDSSHSSSNSASILSIMKDYKLRDIDREYFKVAISSFEKDASKSNRSPIIQKIKAHLQSLLTVKFSVAAEFSAITASSIKREMKSSPQEPSNSALSSLSLIDDYFLSRLLSQNNSTDIDLILSYLQKVEPLLYGPAKEVYKNIKCIKEEKALLDTVIEQAAPLASPQHLAHLKINKSKI